MSAYRKVNWRRFRRRHPIKQLQSQNREMHTPKIPVNKSALAPQQPNQSFREIPEVDRAAKPAKNQHLREKGILAAELK